MNTCIQCIEGHLMMIYIVNKYFVRPIVNKRHLSQINRFDQIGRKPENY